MPNFEDIAYLQSGNERQRAAYEVLLKYEVMQKLAPFDPLLAGTIPIGIDVAQSDLDIICCWKSKTDFRQALLLHFSACPGFVLRERAIRGQESIVASFWLDDFEVEVFGQSTPSREQHAYRHMLVEYKLLQKYDEPLRQQVVHLKKQGVKTEPAFARLLNLPGDPYEALLRLEERA
ncbi:DUF4269 domain-containing protein [Pontibacter chinhatensis]|uniref:DUF4269 domain-containing protein n=1 Tax=Pontibacter chinhatensis TaxID=1436961 RepID=A0A1I2YUB6_9BACT|nr:DUF4269 domain-containing protein [Pontibacter chinhatensis]SFH29238.1 protein of unknown function [Pontibacter chinhatensis]